MLCDGHVMTTTQQQKQQQQQQQRQQQQQFSRTGQTINYSSSG